MKETFLFVDDERPILKTLQRTFHGTGYRILTAASGEEALGIIGQEKIDIIVSDLRMPHMSGHELLRRIREHYPSTIRIILSGHVEEAETMKAMLDGSCKTYLMKPWDSQLLLATLQRLLSVRDKLSEKTLIDIVSDMEQLCAIPQVYTKLQKVVNQDADMSQIAAIIEEDPVLTAKILHFVNSVYYGIRTGSIQQAIAFLGLETVKNISFSIHLCDLVSETQTDLFSKEFFWRHACIANKIMAQLHKKLIGKSIPQTASSAGVLLDVGLMALVSHFPEKYRQISEILKLNPERLLEDVEKELIGTTHHDVGGYLIEWWGLPQPLLECVVFYHDPFNECVTDNRLVSIAHLANYFTRQLLNPDNSSKVDERALSNFSITLDDCKELLKNELKIN